MARRPRRTQREVAKQRQALAEERLADLLLEPTRIRPQTDPLELGSNLAQISSIDRQAADATDGSIRGKASRILHPGATTLAQQFVGILARAQLGHEAHHSGRPETRQAGRTVHDAETPTSPPFRSPWHVPSGQAEGVSLSVPTTLELRGLREVVGVCSDPVVLGKLSIDRIIRRTLSREPAASGLYGLLDAARDPQIYRLLLRSDVTTRCLLGNDISETLARVAPYVVALGNRELALRTAWRDGGLGHAWGTLVTSGQSLDRVAAHFKTLLNVQLANGSDALFRFYDPRVLRAFLPTCSPEQLARFFAEIDTVVCEQTDGSWLAYTTENGQLVTRAPNEDEDL